MVLSDADIQIPEQIIYGLIGYNGAGKTTLLKMMNGIYRQDSGSIRIDGEPIYENEKLKRRMFMMTEELFFLPQAALCDMERFYSGYYENWNTVVYHRLLTLFELNEKMRISEFSKGMQRKAGLAIAFAAGPEYLFLDEAFDGLDLGVRKIMRRLARLYVEKRKATLILTSHNLQELEECVDQFGMIKDGTLLCSMEVEQIKNTGKTLESYFLLEGAEQKYEWETIFDEAYFPA